MTVAQEEIAAESLNKGGSKEHWIGSSKLGRIAQVPDRTKKGFGSCESKEVAQLEWKYATENRKSENSSKYSGRQRSIILVIYSIKGNLEQSGHQRSTVHGSLATHEFGGEFFSNSCCDIYPSFRSIPGSYGEEFDPLPQEVAEETKTKLSAVE